MKQLFLMLAAFTCVGAVQAQTVKQTTTNSTATTVQPAGKAVETPAPARTVANNNNTPKRQVRYTEAGRPTRPHVNVVR